MRCFPASVAVTLALAFLLPASAQDVTLHGGTSVVLVPTLVTDLAGEPVFGLSARDFAIYDNGVEQKIQLDETLRSQPTSVVVAIERGHSADETLDKVKRIGSLLYPIVGEGKGEAAVVAFDSKSVLIQDFTGDLDQVTRALSRISVGDYNAASLDAISYSAALLEQRPSTNRKVLFLVCEPTDRGSAATIPEVIRRVERSNVLVYGAAYQPGTAAKMDKVGQTIADPLSHPVNLFGIFSALTKSAKENIPETIAEMSGGEYLLFNDEKKLEEEMTDVSNHYFNQYLLSFTPKKLSLGQHSLRVEVRGRSDVVLSARTGYWVGEALQKDVPAGKAPAGSSAVP
ncbi:MAG: VWA domain-containing protein [Candidatus Korobacteraceae bacterium]